MHLPADVSRSRRHPKRLPVAELELRARQLAKGGEGPRPAILVLRLNRSDRLRALAQRPDAVAVLLAALDRLDAALRQEDRFAVVAVDEIWVVLSAAGSESILRLAATALRETLSLPFDSSSDDGVAARVTLAPAIGGAWCEDPKPTPSISALLSIAGQACRQSRGSEDRILILSAGSDANRQFRDRIESLLLDALGGNRLEVHFQPQVRLRDWQCPSLEALVRWPQNHPDRIEPALIAEICEERGLMMELTRFVLNTTLRQLSQWRTSGQQLRASINLSATTLSERDFPGQVEQACSTWGIKPAQLVFELTESAIARHERATLEFMHRLRDMGCGLAIDDFGTGYSSFAYLRQFPLDELKIDRSFVHRLAHDAADQRIVQAVVDLAHTFGLRALAEGAEDAATVDALRKAGCDAVQGWFVAKALPGAEVSEWVRSFNESSRPTPNPMSVRAWA
jgi:diguanylate cyclase